MAPSVRTARPALGLALALALSGPAAVPRAAAEEPPAATAPVIVDDFEAPELRAGWTGRGADLAVVPGESGSALRISASAAPEPAPRSAGCPLPVRDLRRFDAVSFRIRPEGGVGRIQVFLRKGSTWRILEESVEILSAGWQEVVLPLRFMVPDSHALLPSAEDLDRFEIQWPGPGGSFLVDDLRLVPGSRGEDSWRLRDEVLLEMAFGRGRGKIQNGKHFALLAATPAWQGPDGTRRLADLEKSVAILESRYGITAPAGLRIRLVCADDLDQHNRMRAGLHMHFLAEGLYPANALDRGVYPFALVYPAPAKSSPGKPAEGGIDAFIGASLGLGDRTWLVRALEAAFLRRARPDLSAGMARMHGTVTAEDFQKHLAGKPGVVRSWPRLLGPDGWSSHAAVIATIPEFLAAVHRAKLPRAWDAVRALEGDPDAGAMAAIAGALEVSEAKLEDQWARWGATSWK